MVKGKPEKPRYRKLFGLTDNIALEGEDDLVLQREFRVDFVLRKTDLTELITGIFSHFKEYNLLEFKSVNDPLTMLLLIKYIGQLFWWLFAKNTEAKKNKSDEIGGNEVTLNIVSVRQPRNVISELDERLGEDLIRRGGGIISTMSRALNVEIRLISFLGSVPDMLISATMCTRLLGRFALSTGQVHRLVAFLGVIS